MSENMQVKISKNKLHLIIFGFLGFSVLGLFFLNASYPASQTEFFVAPNGSDLNPGTMNQPLFSLEKARDLAALAARDARNPINVYLRSGTYFRDTPLIFLPEHSGTAISPIRFLAYGMETPVVTGAVSVNGAQDCQWSQARVVNDLPVHRCVLKSPVADRLRFYINQIKSSYNNGQFAMTSLFVGSERRTRARHPNQDKLIDLKNLQMEINRPYQEYYNRVPEFITTTQDWGVLSPSLANQGVELIFSNLWQHTRGLVTEVKFQDGRNSIRLNDLTLNASMVTFLNHGGEVGRLENHSSFVDSRGEWYFDETNLAFEYIPMLGEDFKNQLYQFPINSKLIELKGASKANPVQNVSFEKLKFQYSSWVYQNGVGNSKFYAWAQSACGVGGMIDGNFVKNIKIKENQFLNYGLSGISLGGNRGTICAFADNSMVENVVISNNEFNDGGASAIRLDSFKNLNSYVKVHSNVVKNFGRIFEDAVGINVLSPANYTLITANTVHRGSYTGINAGWKCRNTSSEQIIVENNRVEDVMKRLTDGGGIYNNGSQGYVLNNFVSTVGENRDADAKAYRSDHFWGIYLDDTSLFWNVDGNSFGSPGASSLMYKLALGYNPQTTHRISSQQISGLSRYNAVATQADVAQCEKSSDGTSIDRTKAPSLEPLRTTCKVTIKDCPQYSYLANREVVDSYDDADVDLDRCLRRAKDYYDYCAAQAAVTARFMKNSTLLAEKTHVILSLPGSPMINSVTAGNAQITLLFSPPSFDGNSPILGYDVQILKANDLSIVKTISGVSSPYIALGLTNGVPYVLKMRARNSIGEGLWSPLSRVITPLTPNLFFAAGALNLTAGQSKDALNLKLSYQTDGQLVVTSQPEGVVLWKSNSLMNCATGCTAVFQTDGNLVLRRNGSPYWASNSVVPALGSGGQLQITASSPYVRILDYQGVAIWRGTDINATSLSFLTDQFFMYPGSDIIASGFQLGFTQDGRLILYKLPGYAILWQSERNAYCTVGPCFAVFQSDANLVLYKGSPTNWSAVTSYWWANTVAFPSGSKLTFQGTLPYVRITKPDGQQVYPK